MGRIKRKYEFLYPFCYYCDKVFPNEISNINISYDNNNFTPVNTPIRNENMPLSNYKNRNFMNLYSSIQNENKKQINMPIHIEENDYNYIPFYQKENEIQKSSQKSQNKTHLGNGGTDNFNSIIKENIPNMNNYIKNELNW